MQAWRWFPRIDVHKASFRIIRFWPTSFYLIWQSSRAASSCVMALEPRLSKITFRGCK